jgi:hypothetical protein
MIRDLLRRHDYRLDSGQQKAIDGIMARARKDMTK